MKREWCAVKRGGESFAMGRISNKMLTFFSVERKNSAWFRIKLNEGCVFCVAFMKAENQFPVVQRALLMTQVAGLLIFMSKRVAAASMHN